MAASHEDTETEIDVEEDFVEAKMCATDVRKGEDMQEIQWQMTNMTRDKYIE